MAKRDLDRLAAAAGQMTKERDFWLTQLAGDLEKSSFPVDGPGEMAGPADTAIFPFDIPGPVREKLLKMSKGSDVKLHILLVSVLAVLLARYSGKDEAIFATPIYKQPEDIDFINTLLILKIGVKPGSAFKDLLLQVKDTVMEAVAHQNYPVEILLQELGFPVRQDETGLLDVALLYDNAQERKYLQSLDYRLLFVFSRQPDRLLGSVEYRPEYYRLETSARLSAHFQNLLTGLTAEVERPLIEIELLSAREKEEILTDFNSTGREYRCALAVHERFLDQANKGPDRIALLGPGIDDLTDGLEMVLSYRELNRRAADLAGVLRGRGVGPDTLVAIQLERSVEMIIGILGILKAGGAYLPIDPETPQERVEYMLADSGAEIIIGQTSPPGPLSKRGEGGTERGAAAIPGTGMLNRIAESPQFVKPQAKLSTVLAGSDGDWCVSPAPGLPTTSLAYVIYTSGSTGRPKGVLVSHSNLSAYIDAFLHEFQPSCSDTFLQQATPAFDTFGEEVYPILVSGGKLAVIPRRQVMEAAGLADFIIRHHVTMISVSPLVLDMINRFVNLERLPIHTYISGGDVLKTAYVDRLVGRAAVYNTYGPTETTVCATYYRLTGVQGLYPPIGRPIAHYRVYIMDKWQHLCPKGVAGELWIGGHGLTRGYLNNPELTAERFVTSPFTLHHSPLTTHLYKTGDLGRWLDGGNIEFLGRIDQQVKIRGFRIELGEIEAQLLKHPAIKEALVIARTDPGGEKALCAYLIPQEPATPTGPEPAELREFLAAKLPGYLIPAYFVQLERFPLTVSGKIDKKALPEPQLTRSKAYIAPRDEMEERLTGIWADVLGIDRGVIGIESDFFDLGGYSWKATVLASRISQEFSVKLPLTEIFHTPTIKALGDFLRRSDKQVYAGLPATEKKEYYPLSLTQQRFYFIQKLNPGKVMLNMSISRELAGDIDVERLTRAFKSLIQRHETLRTSFIMVGAEPVQRVHDQVDFELEVLGTGGRGGQGGRNGQGSERVAAAIPAPAPDRQSAIMQGFVRPFDLAKAPLMRAALINLENRALLLIDLHHTICDGISLAIIGHDFLALYEDRPLPPLKLQYRDFAEWQRFMLAAGQLDVQGAYWLKRLAGRLPVLRLPTDFPRPTERSYAGATVTFSLDTQLTARVQELSRQTGTTLYMILLAAFTIVLSRYSGQYDILVGSPVAGRHHADMEQMIGLLMGALVMRNFPLPEKLFTDYLAEVKDHYLLDFEHQAYPFERLLEKLDWQEEAGHSPITDVSLLVQNLADTRHSPGEPAGPILKHTTTQLDLTLVARERGDDIAMALEYSTDLFKPETARRFSGHLVNLLQAVTGDPHISLAAIDITEDEEKMRVIGSLDRCYPLSHAQRRIFYTEKILGQTPCHTIVFCARFAGKLDKEILQQAIDLAVQKNDALRLRIVEFASQAGPGQFISAFRPITLPVIDLPESPDDWLYRYAGQPLPLVNAGLYDFAYLRFNERETGFCIRLHHVVADGWSAVSLVREITETFRALMRGEIPDHTPNPSYLEYLRQEQAYLRSGQAVSDREFWFESLLPLPEETLTWPGKAGFSPDMKAGESVLPLSSALRQALHQYAAGRKSSLFKIILTALYLYFSRVNGHDDAVIASFSHNRHQAVRKKMPGMMVSTFPVRVRIGHDLDFSTFVAGVGDTLDTIVKQHQEYPFDRLSAEIDEKTGLDPAYLLDVNLVGHPDMPGEGYRLQYYFPGYDPSPLSIHINVNNQDIHGILELSWYYQEQRFDRAEIESMQQCLVAILDNALKAPHLPIERIELVSETQKQVILEQFSTGPAVDLPAPVPVYRAIAGQAEKHPDRLALVAPLSGEDVPDMMQLTFRELVERALGLAGELGARGAGPNTVTALLLKPSVDMALAILGVLMAGSAYLPIDPDSPQERIDYMLADSGAEIIIGQHGVGANCCSPIQDIGAECKGERQFAPTDLAYVIYTSGTSGRPKGVAVEHRQLLAYLAAFDREFAITGADIALQQASYTFDAFVEEFYPVLIKGGRLVIAPGQLVLDIERLTSLMARLQVTFISFSPLLLRELNRVQAGLKAGEPGPFSSLRIVISGGDRLFKDHIDCLVPLAQVYNTYGPTETTVCATYYRCPGKESLKDRVSIGKPIGNYRVYILDRFLNVLPIGLAGELCIAGPGLSRGYLNNPELTAERFVTSPLTTHHSPITYRLYKTGDLARWLDDGNIEFLGRIDQQVKIRGFRIELPEIETQLGRHPAIKETVVMAREAGEGESYLCAYLVLAEKPTPGHTSLTGELRQFLGQRLPAYMVPAHFVFIDRIPRNQAGKVDSRRLPGPETLAGQDYAPPETEIEKKLAGIWADVLGRNLLPGSSPGIGRHDDFFDLGGHSLKATLLAARIQQAFEVKIPLPDIFKTRSLENMAGWIAQARPVEFLDISRLPEQAFYELSYHQQRLWIIHQLNPQSPAFHIPLRVPIQGEFVQKALKDTLYAVIDRHESLRTGFTLHQGEPRQFILQKFDFPFQVIDLSTLAAEKKEQERERCFSQLASQPFDLAKPPLFRFLLIKLADNNQELYFNFHHLIADGWSLNVLRRDFTRLYTEFCQDRSVNLPALKIQYRDFAAWQNTYVQRPEIREAALRYWSVRLARGVPLFQLPASQAIDRIDIGGAGYRFMVNGEIKDRLNEVAQKNQTSLFTVMFSIYLLLLCRLSGKQQMACSIISAGRTHIDLREVMGFFVNSLVFTAEVDPAEPFSAFLSRMSRDILEMFQYQDYPLEIVCEQLKIKYPEVPVSFNMFNTQDATREIDLPAFSPQHLEKAQDVKFDIEPYLTEYRNGIDILCVYKKSLFKPATIAYMFEEYQRLLDHFSQNPGGACGGFQKEEKKHVFKRVKQE